MGIAFLGFNFWLILIFSSRPQDSSLISIDGDGDDEYALNYTKINENAQPGAGRTFSVAKSIFTIKLNLLSKISDKYLTHNDPSSEHTNQS